MMMNYHQRRKIDFITIISLFLFLLSFVLPTANAGSTYYEKLEHGMRMIRDLITRTGHENNENNENLLQLLPKKYGQLSLISGGFPRTGTKSIETALSQLGHKVYDSRAMIAHNHFDGWINATKEYKTASTTKNSMKLMTEMVQEIESLGYTATLDIPMNLLAPALIEIRPKAKVLWNYRSKGFDDWYRSMIFINWFAQPLFYARPFKWIMPNPSEQMKPLVEMLANVDQFDLIYPTHLERILPWYERLINNQHPMEFDDHLKSQWKIAYMNFPSLLQETIQKVHTTTTTTTDGRHANNDIMKKYYLEYTIQEGWDPLLHFLLLEDDDANDVGGESSIKETIAKISQTDFPHVNDRNTLIFFSKILNCIGITFPLWLLLLASGCFVVVRNTFKLIVITFDRKKPYSPPNKKKITKLE